MALSFIKRVFTFGKDKPAEGEPRVADQAAPQPLSPEELSAVEAELEPHSREEDLPLAADPVLAEEMETAGGPADDILAVEAEILKEEIEAALPLPAAEQIGDLGVTPLSLLEAEAAVEAKAEEAPPAISPLEGEMPDRAKGGEELSSFSDIAVETPETEAFEDEADLPPSVPSGHLPLKGGDQTEDAAAPVLPKGFATAPAVIEPVAEAPKAKLSWFQRLRQGLARTSSQLTGQIAALFTKRKLDEDTLQELEDLLIQADLGVETALRVTDTLASERYGKDVTGEDVSRIMAAEITKVLSPVAKPLQLDLSHKPHVILVVGVNGTGKTTTIGKLAAKLSGAGLKVMLAAGDTFRAAAIEQLKIWAERTKSDIVSSKLGADAAGLAYEAFEQAKLKKSDVLIIDTAGRLQNRTELMAELEKIVRVLGKLDPDAPHTVLQTLDATTGQNALNQVEIFRNVAGVNGLIMTKLDGTARGGILVAISAKHKLPVYFIGVGEGVDDLEPFEAKDFAEAIAGIAH
ncbi:MULTISPECIES: signal recognition particle-docking protein FtsY [unclassified Rhizobium]|uniref:signal recognition particle-docking protein FtsY n=1 Tax=unclassified Rhizobium TaxID=2613769 RepID=UPI0006FE756C|nr:MULTISPECIES: signal recognition particle-docking protein FtsY [unclassified Rhizobium]KQV35676.1 signal recognition particle-docking protein FtsY [Rhizobium sp. Root1212]KRD25783.1 signal recognition particle-docking protein FtsY [Rhizobium sp. Root268]